MKNIIATLAWMAVLSIAAGKAPAKEEALTGDLAKIQGKWTTSAGPRRDIAVTMEIQGRAVNVDIKTPLGVKIHAEGEIKINESASPKAIDWVRFTSLDGQDLPEILAIYELNGDTLKLANGGANNGRPTEFKPGEGALADVVTLTRPKSEGKGGTGKSKSSVALAPAPR